ANLSGAFAVGADFTGVDVTGTTISDLLTDASTRVGTIASGVVNFASGVDLSGFDVRRFDFSGLDLTGISLTGLDLRNLNLNGALNVDLTGVTNLFGVDLRNVGFASGFNQVLSGLDLRHANLAGLDLRGFDLSGVRLSGAALADSVADATTILHGAQLQGVDLSGIAGIDVADLASAAFDSLTQVPGSFDLSGFFGLFGGTVDVTLPDVFGTPSDAPPFAIGGGFDFDTHEVTLDVQVNLHPLLEIDFDLDTAALGLDDVGVSLSGAGTLAAGAVIELAAGVGVDLDALNLADSGRPALSDSVFFTLDTLRAGAGVQVSGLNLSANLGPISGGVEDGHASLVVGAEVAVSDPDDSDGHITVAELSQAEFGFGVLGTLDAELPLAATLPAIGTITDFGTPTVLISAPELIAGSAPNFTVNRPSVSVNILLENQEVQDNILALLDDLSTGGFGSVSFLDDDLPLVGKSINELVGAGIGDLLDLHTSVKGYFDSFDDPDPNTSATGVNFGGTPDLAGLVDWVIEDVSQHLSTLFIGGDLADGPFTMSGGLDFATNTLLFNFDFDLNKATDIQIDIDELVPGGGFIDFGGAINAQLLGSVSAGFGLGLDLDELFGGTASEAVFLTIDDLSVSGELHIPDIDLTVGLGTAVSGGIVDGTLDLELGATLSVADPDGDGRLTLNEIQTAGFGNLISLDSSASVNGAMPLNITVAGFDPTLYGTPVVYLSGDDFLRFDPAGTPEKFTFTRPDVVFDIKLTADFRDAVMGVLTDLDGKIDSVVAGPVGDFLTFDIPGLNTTVGDLLGVNDLLGAFNLYDVAQPYFAGYTFAGSVASNPENFPSLLGLLEELNTGVAAKASVAIDAFDANNARGNFAGFDAVSHFNGESWPLDLRGFDFRKAILTGVNFTGFDLSGVDFRGADLRG
ncbi:MAG: pentapeptide repeat-containing protein, partial [Planctomycetes bacterium]|nr:pentapeptide repeat-containing protein [Planctomycetota bacterium]